MAMPVGVGVMFENDDLTTRTAGLFDREESRFDDFCVVENDEVARV